MNYGYIRVSTRDQNEERQRLAMGELEIPEKNLYLSLIHISEPTRPY